MNLRVLFLGTGAWAPTARRGAAATMLIRGGEHILVDCGEGTQRQMTLSAAGLGALTTILITHTHPDHVLGLPGLLATYSDARDEPLTVAGPHGLADLMVGFRRFHGRLGFPMSVFEVAPGHEISRGGYRLRAIGTRHGTPSVGWLLAEEDRPGHLDVEAARARGVPPGPALGRLADGQDLDLPDGTRVDARGLVGPPERGRRILVTGDTSPCPEIEQAACEVDLLIHEATFLEQDRALAVHAGHSTATEVASLAARCGARLLALTHVSSRYPAGAIEREAQALFPASIVPEDFDVVELPLPEHGLPQVRRGAGRST